MNVSVLLKSQVTFSSYRVYLFYSKSILKKTRYQDSGISSRHTQVLLFPLFGLIIALFFKVSHLTKFYVLHYIYYEDVRITKVEFIMWYAKKCYGIQGNDEFCSYI